MSEGIRVLIVDDQPRARQSLRALLATMPEIGEVREAEGGMQAVESVSRSGADVVLMDVIMPELDGLQATRMIKQERPDIRVVILTLYPEFRQAALEAGADGFVTKEGPSQALFEALLNK
ncbi:MAG: response regulator transcription factor [Rudaea sp.]